MFLHFSAKLIKKLIETKRDIQTGRKPGLHDKHIILNNNNLQQNPNITKCGLKPIQKAFSRCQKNATLTFSIHFLSLHAQNIYSWFSTNYHYLHQIKYHFSFTHEKSI